jgi:hypothetical protein
MITKGWMCRNRKNYKYRTSIMIEQTIYNKWTDFINSDKYSKYMISREEDWLFKYEKLINFIDINKRKPRTTEYDENEKSLCIWINHTIENFLEKKGIFKNKDIYTKWDDFINNETYKNIILNDEDRWFYNLEQIKKYIDENNKLPSSKSINEEVKKMGRWIVAQNQKYKKKEFNMKNEIVYNKWTEFIKDNKYSDYFLEDDEKWKDTFDNVKKYIDTYNKKPSSDNIDVNISYMGGWITNQNRNFNEKKGVMNNSNIYTVWQEFMNNPIYYKYFMTDKEIWRDNFEKTKTYIDKNAMLPTSTNNNEIVKKLGAWVVIQKQNYKKKERSMVNDENYNLWKEFINDDKYIKYFMTDNEIWNDNLETLKKYIDEHHKKPSRTDETKKISSLIQWIHTQKRKYKNKIEIMKDPEIYNRWTDFITNPQYKQYFD